jgi:hypothetical protein
VNGKVFLPKSGREFFLRFGREFFSMHGKENFPRYGKDFLLEFGKENFLRAEVENAPPLYTQDTTYPEYTEEGADAEEKHDAGNHRPETKGVFNQRNHRALRNQNRKAAVTPNHT